MAQTSDEGGKTMAVQIRHRESGVFQGECLGMAFFHPEADMPEQGYCAIAEAQIDRVLRRLTEDYGIPRDMLSVEPFDAEESDRLIRAGANHGTDDR